MDENEMDENERAKPFMLFGRDVTQIPCFKKSMLYGIYGGIGSGVATFLLTSRVKRSTEIALASYMSITLVYWCYCRYDNVRQKYVINDLRAMMRQQSAVSGEMEIYETQLTDQKSEKKLVDVS